MANGYIKTGQRSGIRDPKNCITVLLKYNKPVYV